jgi:hypothetical protein
MAGPVQDQVLKAAEILALLTACDEMYILDARKRAFSFRLNTKKALKIKAWQHCGIKCLRFMPRKEKGHKRG